MEEVALELSLEEEKVCQSTERKGVMRAQKGELTPRRGSWQQKPDEGVVLGAVPETLRSCRTM